MPIATSGIHSFQVQTVRIAMPELPPSLLGLRIAHISDIHSGSFYNKTSVKKGVHLLLQQRADMVFFTGDLVNKVTREVEDFFPLLSRIQAPLGVFSVLGNHDYGDYVNWPSKGAKHRNLMEMLEVHRRLGWQLLLNENRLLQIGKASLAVLGVENWGMGHFSKYGRLDEASKGTEEADLKLLLSHDPSHWEARVIKDFPDIDVTFSGHTHGFQFGLEMGRMKLSPSRFKYKHWAGLYEHDGQYLYVNRGFGYMMNLPFRLGIRPEITVLELVKEDRTS